jgi:hypothetical protein
MTATPMSRGQRLTSRLARLGVAVILAQTLFFKFTAAPESVYIFSKLGLEPWGRIASGVAELVAVVLLALPGTVIYGALLALGVIVPAIASHLGPLGIVVQGDGGLLFGLALAVLAGSLLLVVLHRRSLPVLGRRFE